MPNGNLEEVISPVQHECRSSDHIWACREVSWELGKLFLRICDGDPYEDGYENSIQVSFCPFCGYFPNK